MSDLIEELRNFIIEELDYSGPPDRLGEDFPLIESRVVDSVALVQIVAFLEERYDIEIDDEDLTPDNFASLGSISAFIAQKV